MRILLQRVSEASVTVDGAIVSKIDQGLLLLLGVGEEDTTEDADWLASKVVQMRIFSDAEGKMNLSVVDIGSQLLVVSQFTLFAETRKGNRPSFVRAARPDKAIPLYEYFTEACRNLSGLTVQTGVFGADMKVSLINDGPVSIWIDSKLRE